MAKAKLTEMTERWIDGKTERHNGIKLGRPNTGATEEKAKQTLYISKQAIKLLWHNRVETGVPISVAVEKLVMEHLGKKVRNNG